MMLGLIRENLCCTGKLLNHGNGGVPTAQSLPSAPPSCILTSLWCVLIVGDIIVRGTIAVALSISLLSGLLAVAVAATVAAARKGPIHGNIIVRGRAIVIVTRLIVPIVRCLQRLIVQQGSRSTCLAEGRRCGAPDL